MLSKRATDRIADILLVLIFVAFAIFIGTFVEFDRDREDVRESLADVIDDEALYATSWAFNLAGGLLLVAGACALNLVFRPHERALGLFVLVTILAAGVAIAMATMVHLGVLFLARDFLDASGAEADALVGTARAFGVMGFAAQWTGLTLLGAGVLSLGVLIVRTKVMALWLGWWAVLSGAFLLASWSIVNTPGPVFVIPAIGTISTLLLFLALGARLMIQGSPQAASPQP